MILLDTHAWIWWASQSPKLSAAAEQAIANEAEVGVAVISCWEVAMLVDKGRLKAGSRHWPVGGSGGCAAEGEVAGFDTADRRGFRASAGHLPG